MDSKQIDISPENLKMQIEGFSNFERELPPGAPVKKMMEGKKSGDLWQLAPSDITVVPGFNPRVHNRAYFEGVEQLAEQMKEHGYYKDKPLAVVISKVDGEDRFVLHDGHRRHAAVLRAIEMGAPIKTVPVVLKERTDNMVDLTLGLLHSNEGEPFTTFEKAVLAKRLKKYGWENKQIAAEFRCTTAAVGQLLTMASAPQAIAELVQNGNLSATELHRLILTHGAEEATRLATEGMAKAKAAGRTKITAKDLTPSERKERNSKKWGPQLYKAVTKLLRNEKVIKAMTNEEHAEIDAILSEIEKKPKVKAEPKPKKEKPAPAAKKVAAKKAAPAAKKTGKSLAQKIGETASKGGEIKTKDGSGKGFFDKLSEQEAAKKAAKDGAQARHTVLGQRRSDR